MPIKNTVILFFRMLAIMAASLYTVRILLNALGPESYGVYVAATASVAVLSFVSVALSNSTQRAISISLAAGQSSDVAKAIFSAVLVHILFSMLVLVIGALSTKFILPWVLNLPSEMAVDFNILFYWAIFSSIFQIFSIPLSALIISKEDAGYFSAISIFDAVLKLVAAFSVSAYEGNRLVYSGKVIFLASLATLFVYLIVCAFKYKEFRSFCPPTKKEVFFQIGFLGWSLIGNLASAGRLHGVNIVISSFFGFSYGAAHSIANQVQSAANSFANSLQTAINPRIYKAYGSGDIEELNNMVLKASILSFFLVSIMVLPIISNLDQVVMFWLGQGSRDINFFIRWGLVITLVESLSLPLISAAASTGKIRNYQLIVGFILMANVPAVWVAYSAGLSPYSFIPVAVTFSIICLLVRVEFLKRMIGFNANKFYASIARKVIPFSVACFSSLYLIEYLARDFDGWPGLIINAALCLASILIISFVLLFDVKSKVLNLLKPQLKIGNKSDEG